VVINNVDRYKIERERAYISYIIYNNNNNNNNCLINKNQIF
jgi:hypothetical protein